ncbi:hypothetical protein [Mucilaginibacter phyllosphaerae]
MVERSFYPFEDISIETEKTAKRALSVGDIVKIYNSKYKVNSAKWHARNYFFLSFCFRGASFIIISRSVQTPVLFPVKVPDIFRMIFQLSEFRRDVNIDESIEAGTEIVDPKKKMEKIFFKEKGVAFYPLLNFPSANLSGADKNNGSWAYRHLFSSKINVPDPS